MSGHAIAFSAEALARDPALLQAIAGAIRARTYKRLSAHYRRLSREEWASVRRMCEQNGIPIEFVVAAGGQGHGNTAD